MCDANVNGKGDRLISTPNSKVKVYVIPTNEELVIARDTKRLLNLINSKASLEAFFIFIFTKNIFLDKTFDFFTTCNNITKTFS